MLIHVSEGENVFDSVSCRDWLPHVPLCRLSIRDYPSFCPPAFSVVPREHSDGFQFGVVQKDGKVIIMVPVSETKV